MHPTSRTPTSAPHDEAGHRSEATAVLAGDGDFTASDPLALFRALEASERFRRDTPLGGIFHRGKISFREVSPTDSLHVIIEGNRVSCHVDDVSPLNCQPEGSSQYALARVLTHNLYVLVADVRRRLRGEHGRHRCNLECEAVWVDEIETDGSPAEPGHEPQVQPADIAPVPSVAPAVAPAVSAAVAAAVGHADPAAVPDRVPFGLIDEAVHLLDSEAASWSIQVEVRVGGTLDEVRLQAALATAVSMHPMARARKAPSRRTRHTDHWEIPATTDVDPLRVVDCPDDDSLSAARAGLQSRGVPLVESPPLRTVLARHPGGDVLMRNVNHAAMDGFGVLAVLQATARAYAGTPQRAPALGFVEARELPVRLADRTTTSCLRRQLVLLGKLRDLVVPPARLAHDGADGEAGYGFHHQALSAAQTEALGRPDLAGTVNDVLLAALHLTIAGWNDEHRTPCRRIGVLVPSNLRPAEWRGDMVGNFSLPARVSTNRRQRRSPTSALRAVTAQTRRKKEVGMGTALIELLGRSPMFPLWAKQAMVWLLPVTGNRLVDTAMLSNLGPLPETPTFGPDAGVTTEMWFSPPARMPLGLSIGAVTVDGRLHLGFRYRHGLFSADAARRFAERYVSNVALVADGARPGVTDRGDDSLGRSPGRAQVSD
ncbi:hypothetical protein BH18ACT4_BH18ACT4_00460 [soil metagenome]